MDTGSQDIYYWLHIVVLVFILSIPFQPCAWIKYTMWTPLVLVIIWLIFKACPLTTMHKDKTNKHDFVESLVTKVVPKATKQDADNFTMLMLLIIAYSSTYRYWRKCPRKLR